ncbi:cytochrome oxidase putative small subunit CydP [Aquitalea sp. ASV11]|uniref:cytochrome oxidase putative small subunit CydP n=1 Tax=Aquitalea sp. ASV11 TaxID=2795103 RepID=UPI0018EBD95D|nr:cytochrome oxidase putative small subunit CydP [Aquitalea sp. ASV11]
MKKTSSKLSRELAWIIAIKVVLLLIIWKAFIAPYRVAVDADSVAGKVLNPAHSSQQLEKNNAR